MADNDDKDSWFEMICGITLAVFAAGLGVNTIGADRYGGDELIAHNEKTTAYAWYSSKGIKENLAEGQRDFLQGLLVAGSIRDEQRAGVEQRVAKLTADVQRYGKEKKEILEGSAAVGEENWAQDIDGEMGKVVGAKVWEKKALGLGEAGDVFDLATLLLQTSLVLGAVSIVLRQPRMRWAFYIGMIVLGVLGTIICVMAFAKVFAVD